MNQLYLLSLLLSASQTQAPDLIAGGPVGEESLPCLQGAERDSRPWIDDGSEAVVRQLSVPRFAFYPMGGVRYGDLWTNNFVDLDPAPGVVLDWDCSAYTYDGHAGNDTRIRTFAEQAIGVPVFAALDGVVTSVRDDQPDMNTSCTGIGNHVKLLHENGIETWYWHLRRNSVRVAVGESVITGRELGLVGSSGCSTNPHLHFEVRWNGRAIEPFSGACQPQGSLWRNQLPIERSLYVDDAAVTRIDVRQEPSWPQPWSGGGQIAFGDSTIYAWFILHNVPANSQRSWEFARPDGSIASSPGPFSFNNATFFRTWIGRFFFTGVPGTQNTPGTWHLRLYVNGSLAKRVPFEVVPTYDPLFNRPPEPIALTLTPSQPLSRRAIVASVASDPVLDDLDYDRVRYDYQWLVNGNPVRDVTSAGRADVLPRNFTSRGDFVECLVTPGDGKLAGPIASASTTIR